MPSIGQAQTTTRVSVAPQGEDSNGPSGESALSANGRYVVFGSNASNLVAGVENQNGDAFLYDQSTGETTRVSVGQQGVIPDGFSGMPTLSADGRFVAFVSQATNLVPEDNNGRLDVFVYDRTIGTTMRVSVGPMGEEMDKDSIFPTISADGRYVAFEASDNIYSTGWVKSQWDVYVYDRQTETAKRVTIDQQEGDPIGEFHPAISGNGRYVAFASSASNLVTGDGNGFQDIFVYDLQTETTERVSVNPQGGDPNGGSFWPSLSADGRYIAFTSGASNLVVGDENEILDVFVYDRQMETTTRVSVDLHGGNSNEFSGFASLSADGRFVAFMSQANNLVEGDGNGTSDIFVFDRKRETTTRVNIGTKGEEPNEFSGGAAISDTGRYVSFWSRASNLVKEDGNGDYDVFVRDRGPAVIGPPGIRDLDGSGTADLLWRNSHSGEVAVWLMDGARMGASGTLGGVSQDWQIAGSGDVDGNGTADVIWRNITSGVVAIWMMKGSRISSIGFPGSASNAWVIKGVGDVDGNEKVDIFWQNAASGQVSVWLMDGSTIVSMGLLPAPPSEEKIAGIGDVNADGKADVLWFNTRTGKVTIWQMDGLTISVVGFPGATSKNWEIQSVGDIDGNGTADVVWRHRTNGVVAVWLMRGSAIVSSGFFDRVPLEWGMPQVGDVDGNGTADVIWHHSISGAVAVWMMDGLRISSVGYPGKVATEWVLADH